MGPLGYVLLQGIGAIVGVVVLWLVAKRKLGFRWAALGWGALAFPLSQLARVAVISPLNAGFERFLEPSVAVTAVTVVLVLSSGLFEESARWVVMRYWAKGVRSWREGVGFGLGHGGIEAILLMGNAMVSNVAMLQFGDVVREQVARTGDTKALEALDSQVELLNTIGFTLVAMGWYERILAIIFHVAMSVLILRAVRERKWQLWLLAVLLHIAFNTVAVTLAPVSYTALYIALTAFTAVVVWALAAGPLARRAVDGSRDVAGLPANVGKQMP
ncbi:YhfC family intramembrane metalloprotease [Corynebacterium sp. TA-R-1]|uniref:YhfC family intramembrane metalloprotease n=1 Tax=Corynebacterium stercoris TaxID=2943490 RepID=A0ABT1G7L1_9CORY|nr:YhfC family glutamic-type intramembrane protease [Corynebacterium stercoris]MCP1388682.1 YhfC family intramembrane metalloprotease [Corynebacterium stercoris]